MKSILSALFVVAAATLTLSAPAAAQTFSFTGFMIGANEVSPVVGDPDASASAFVAFNTTNQTVTYSLTNIQNLQSNFRFWHIHTGAAGVNGGVIVDFGNTFSDRKSTR